MEEKANATKPRHILVVDDNLDLAQTYKELFQAYDYQVSIAGNGVLALKLLMHTDVDAVLCDLSMPQLEGDMFYVAVQRVRPQLANRFIFVTGNAGNPKFDNFVKKVNSPILYKPVSIDRLLAALDGLFAEPA
jgi:CheY-like chemotaxis protein